MKNLLLAFDLDGTLVDSAQDVCNAVNKTVIELNKPLIPDEVIISHIGEGFWNLLADLFPEANRDPKLIERLTQIFSRHYDQVMLQTTKPYPGIEEFLSKFPGSIAIITNKPFTPAKKIIDHLGLGRFPWVQIIGGDSLPEKKPSPIGLHTVMKAAGVDKSHTFMIGDGTPDMGSANAAQVKSIAISFGYTDLGLLRSYKPWSILDRYSDLESLLQTWKG